MTITALETSYASCRFRSRLEARWAVFFDTLGVKWEYEPQGYDVPTATGSQPYLPDFRLPDLSMFVEVKGEANRLDVGLLADFTRAHREMFTVVLGDVPTIRAGHIPLHAMFTKNFDVVDGQEPSIVPVMNKAFVALDKLGDDDQEAVRQLLRHYERQQVICHRAYFIHNKNWVVLMPHGLPFLFPTAEQILNPGSTWTVLPLVKIESAYTAARSARFEHGEQG